MKRITLILAVILLTASVFAACATKENTPGGDTNNNGNTTGTTTVGKSFYDSDLPPDADLGGYEMTVYQKTPDIADVTYCLFWDDELGSASANKIDETVYRRNMIASGQYNFTVAPVYESGDVTTKLNTLILSGDDTYDIGLVSVIIFHKNLDPNLYYDLNSVPNINLKKDYWDQTFIDQLNLLGKTYMGIGDILLTDDDAQMVTVWMKDVARDNQVGDLYEIAENGGFTWDVMLEAIRKTRQDLNSDGTYDINNDRMGLLYAFNNVTFPLLTSADCRLFYKNADGEPELNRDIERIDSVVSGIKNMLLEEGNAFDWINGFGNGNALNQRAGVVSVMNEGRTLFVMPVLSWLRRSFTSVEADFGVLPLPKYEESGEYRTMLYGDYAAIAIPTTAKEYVDKIGFAIEALAAASGEITSSYYDVSLQNRYLRDPEKDVAMLTLARKNVIYDLANIYKWGGIGGQIDLACLGNSRKSTAAIYAGFADSSEAAMQEYINKIKEAER